jgi:hydrogenase maturation protein HypF
MDRRPTEADGCKMTPAPSRQRARLVVRGVVQGVGFRPFVYRLATELDLHGEVYNSAQGVFIEVEGEAEKVQAFRLRLVPEKPPHSSIQSLETTWLAPAGYAAFAIAASREDGPHTTLVLPDIATCTECRCEIFDPANRRHRYPFTNCTHCGPRFSIIQALPYDRPHTTMRGFIMCPTCQAEYEDPADRRFHAQPNACPICGPQLSYWNAQGQPLTEKEEAQQQALAGLRAGNIVAVKGLGGFHLMADARNEAAIVRLRQRKHREEKPFALMFPSLAAIEEQCIVSPLEAALLQASEAPIVLLDRRPGAIGLSPSIAPENPCLGVMLPYSPLHLLLMEGLGFPVVATSGNLSDEPICTDEHEAKVRLRGIADAFLVHNRPIARPVDDSVARVMLGREMVLRRARGYAPLPVPVRMDMPPLLAVGAHLKNTVALARGRHVFLSQHIGDLETAPAREAFERAIIDGKQLLDIEPQTVACDLHPDYHSSRFAQACGLPRLAFQHHAAHVAACLAENELEGPALGVAWDGTGLGTDRTIWGGEFIRMHRGEWQRVAWLRPFRLPGGDAAVKEPCRTAIGMLYELLGDAAFQRADLAPLNEFSIAEQRLLRSMLERGLNSPLTTSAGRLFDAAAALLDLRQQTNYEGQSAMALEWAAARNDRESFSSNPATRASFAAPHYPILLVASDRPDAPGHVADWGPLVHGILADLFKRLPPALIAAKCHRTMAEIIVAVAQQVGEPCVALTGGCFQNRVLMEMVVPRLRAEGFQPCWHQRVPPNDGGIALGQAVMAGWQIAGGLGAPEKR